MSSYFQEQDSSSSSSFVPLQMVSDMALETYAGQMEASVCAVNVLATETHGLQLPSQEEDFRRYCAEIVDLDQEERVASTMRGLQNNADLAKAGLAPDQYDEFVELASFQGLSSNFDNEIGRQIREERHERFSEIVSQFTKNKQDEIRQFIEKDERVVRESVFSCTQSSSSCSFVVERQPLYEEEKPSSSSPQETVASPEKSLVVFEDEEEGEEDEDDDEMMDSFLKRKTPDEKKKKEDQKEEVVDIVSDDDDDDDDEREEDEERDGEDIDDEDDDDDDEDDSDIGSLDGFIEDDEDDDDDAEEEDDDDYDEEEEEEEDGQGEDDNDEDEDEEEDGEEEEKEDEEEQDAGEEDSCAISDRNIVHGKRRRRSRLHSKQVLQDFVDSTLVEARSVLNSFHNVAERNRLNRRPIGRDLQESWLKKLVISMLQIKNLLQNKEVIDEQRVVSRMRTLFDDMKRAMHDNFTNESIKRAIEECKQEEEQHQQQIDQEIGQFVRNNFEEPSEPKRARVASPEEQSLSVLLRTHAFEKQQHGGYKVRASAPVDGPVYRYILKPVYRDGDGASESMQSIACALFTVITCNALQAKLSSSSSSLSNELESMRTVAVDYLDALGPLVELPFDPVLAECHRELSSSSSSSHTVPPVAIEQLAGVVELSYKKLRTRIVCRDADRAKEIVKMITTLVLPAALYSPAVISHNMGVSYFEKQLASNDDDDDDDDDEHPVVKMVFKSRKTRDALFKWLFAVKLSPRTKVTYEKIVRGG